MTPSKPRRLFVQHEICPTLLGMNLVKAKETLQKAASKKRARSLQAYFKTGPGEYGEGDIFLGITVPQLREIAQKFEHLKLSELKTLLTSKLHEERSLALMILVRRFHAADRQKQKRLHNFYMKNRRWVNNWDLVDCSAEHLVGAYLRERGISLLKKLARSKNLWDRRIAMVSTYHFIKIGRLSEPLAIAKMLLHDEQDLIHKASGWMLREVGKKNVRVLQTFIVQNYKNMPRTTLRYAIERFPPSMRRSYLEGRF